MTDKPAESAVERAIYVIESAESEGRITYEEEMTVRAALAELKAKLAAAEAQVEELNEENESVKRENRGQRLDMLNRLAAIDRERKADEAVSTTLIHQLKEWQQRADEAEAALVKTEQALFAANCMLRDLGVHPATLEKL